MKDKTISEVLEKLVSTIGKLEIGERIKLEDQLKEQLGFDELNTKYFLSLYYSWKLKKSDNKEVKIYEKDADDILESEVAYPTAIAPDELMDKLPFEQYSTLKKSLNPQIAQDGVLWQKKMQAGTGTSMVRDNYLKKFLAPGEIFKIGAKGTDLFVAEYGDKKVSLAEVQILQSIKDADDNKYSKIVLNDIVSSETEESIESIWNKVSIVDPEKNYRELIEGHPKIEFWQRSFQYHIPTIDEGGDVSFNRVAPGGHALFGVDALRAAYKENLRPQCPKKVLISSIGNGEDLSSSPDEYMISWMISRAIPIAMVTTTKSNIDLKGGQIALIPNVDRNVFVTIIEKAQAEMSGQIDLFEVLGLRDDDKEAFFNTNMILINYNALSPRLSKLVDKIGEEEFLRIISPDLIQNPKRQTDRDGSEHTYVQLEGAMGSVILNLDRYWRQHFDESLVHVLNVGVGDRTKFFSPVKTAFDFYMQFHSDRFTFNSTSFRLKNNNSQSLPDVELKDKFYKDVQNVLDSFVECSIVNLESLAVNGIVRFSKITFAGKIKVESMCNELVDLYNLLDKNLGKIKKVSKSGDRITIHDLKLYIDSSGELVF